MFQRSIKAMPGGKKKDCKKFTHCCESMESLLEDPRIPLRYLDQFREYRLLEGELSTRIPEYYDIKSPLHFGLTLSFCPWCGKKLPESLYETWKQALLQSNNETDSEKLLYLDRYGKKYMSDEWWKDNHE